MLQITEHLESCKTLFSNEWTRTEKITLVDGNEVIITDETVWWWFQWYNFENHLSIMKKEENVSNNYKF